MFNLMFKLIYNKSSLNKSAKIAYVNTQYTLCIQLARKEAGGGGWSNFREEFKIGLRNNFLRYFKYYFRIQFELRRGKNAIQSSGEWIRNSVDFFSSNIWKSLQYGDQKWHLTEIQQNFMPINMTLM